MTKAKNSPGTLAVLSALLLASLLIRASWLEAHVPILCLSRRLGFFCPLCGMCRAFCGLGHGELLQAFAYNPLSPALYAAAWLFWAFLLLKRLRRPKPF